MDRPRPGDELELTIDSLAFGGAGVARIDGYVVFVRDGVPGDRLKAVVAKSKRAYAEAAAVEIMQPSPERIEARAEHPGAPWQVIPYMLQLQTKQAHVQEALARIGHLEDYELEPIIPARQQWRYRNKLEYSFGSDPDGRLVCGFHAPGRWDEIVELDDCLLASERANGAREQVVRWCRDRGLTAYDRRSGQGLLRNLVVREGRRSGQLQVRLVTSEAADFDAAGLVGALQDIDSVLWTHMAELAEVTHGGKTELLSGFERVYDLFCGIGTIALLMAPRAAAVHGLELVEEAVADAIANARLNEIDNARFFAGDVRLALRELAATAGRPDLIVVDPPRAGLSQKIVRRLIEAAPARIVYVSCNPTTLAPNAAQLVQAGYALRRVRPVDMFPQTRHIECVAVLERSARVS